MKNIGIAENIIPAKKKLHAISYLEIVVSLIIITVIVFLTTPFLSHTDKKPKDSFGTYVCYSAYDYKTKSWKLHEISRYNSDYESDEGKLSREDLLDECTFIKPDNIDKFDITVIGGGGGGASSISVNCDKSNKVNCYLKNNDTFNLYTSVGVNGKNGQIVSKNNVLLKDVFEKDKKTSRYLLKLRLCPYGDFKTIESSISNEACIGIGGVGGDGTSYSNYYNVVDAINDIVARYNSSNYITDDASNLSKEYILNTIYVIKPDSASKLKEFYESYNESENKFDKSKFDTAYSDLISLAENTLKNNKNSNISQGRNGTATKFFYNTDNNTEQIVANGGVGGSSSVDKADPIVVKKPKVYLSGVINSEKSGNIPAEILSVLKPEIDFPVEISNCSATRTSCIGDDAKFYIGAGGDGGGIMYNFGTLSRDKNISFHNHSKNISIPYFIAGHGGQGGGGAIIIRW